jgi:hypothetical protein
LKQREKEGLRVRRFGSPSFLLTKENQYMSELPAVKSVKYRGVAFEYGDRIIVIPNLNTIELEQGAEHLDAIDAYIGRDRSNETKIDYPQFVEFFKKHMAPLITAAAQRNYPDFSEGDARAMFGVMNWSEAYAALLGTSSKPKTKGEVMPLETSPSPSVN